nr:PilZ domain-containing protein [Persephonella atlantica]
MYWYLIDKKPPFPFDVGDTVKIRFTREDDAVYIIEGKINEIYQEDGKYIIKIPHTFRFIQIQRRRDFRLKAKIPLELTTYTKDGKQVKMEIETTDISIDGVGFCIPVLKAKDLKMDIGTVFSVKLKFEEREIESQAIVKNVREIGKNVCYGSEFKDISNDDKNFLIKFIHTEQQKLLKEYKRLKIIE